MMRRAGLAVLLAVLALPLAAQERMSPDLCQDGWRGFFDAMGTTGALRDAQNGLSADGRCHVQGGQSGIKASDFQHMYWRAEGLDRAIAKGIAPLGLEAEFSGVDAGKSFGLVSGAGQPLPLAEITVAARQDVAGKRVVLEQALFQLGGIGSVSMTGKVRGVDLGSRNAMQLSPGSARLEDLRIEVDGQLLGDVVLPSVAAASGVQQVDLAEIGRMIAPLPDAVLPSESRAALMVFGAELPAARGKLVVIARSERGLGMLQLAMAANAGERAEAEARARGVRMDYGPILAQMLDGVVLDIRWVPAP